MPLLMLDLDNTIVDRTGAVRHWAHGLVESLGRPPVDTEWILAADGEGTEDREVLAAMIRDRFELKDPVYESVLAVLQGGFVSHIETYPGVVEALMSVRQSGWTIVVVTNGPEWQQTAKLRHAGLTDHIDGAVVSGAIGVAKPDTAIFEAAAAQVSLSLAGAWMIGDSAHADIRGAHNAGIRSVWLHRERTWPIGEFEPTLTADSFPDAVRQILGCPV